MPRPKQRQDTRPGATQGPTTGPTTAPAPRGPNTSARNNTSRPKGSSRKGK